MLNPRINLAGKTAIITGASRGIGNAAAHRLAKADANVVLLARSSDAIDALARDLGDTALAIPCDVSDWTSVEQAFDRGAAQFGSLDLLVNNAGIIDPIARIEHAEPRGWASAVNVNLIGAFNCIRAAVPIMKRGNGGLVINISSGAATSALEGWSHYCATKAALLMLTQCVQKEEATNGINCVGLSPGTVATDLQRTIKAAGINPVSRLDWDAHIPPEWVAEAIAWLTTEAARKHDGADFSIKTPEGRASVGLPLKKGSNMEGSRQ